MWIGTPQPETSDIPVCPHCGEKRTFEAQIMPQLINYLDFEESATRASIDWGVLAIYSCSKSCEVEGVSYMKEIIWRNNVSAR